MCRSRVELLVKKPWNALRAIFNALWSVASCTNSRRQTTLRPISMSTAAWSGVYFRTIVVCQGWRKPPHESELISSLRGACTYGRVSLFASVPSNLIAFTCARALTPTRRGRAEAPSGASCNGVRWPRRVGTRKSAGRKTTEEKTGHRYDLFVLIIIALITARGGARSPRPRYSRTRAHTREAPATTRTTGRRNGHC